MRLPATLLGTLIALSGCAGPQDPGVRQDLRDESAANGLALMGMGDQRPTLIPFDAEKRYLDLSHSRGIPWVVSTSGRLIAWYRQLSPMDILAAAHEPDPIEALKSELVIRTIEGMVVAQRRFLGNVALLAVNEEAGRLALASDSSPEFPRGGTYWRSFDFSSGGFIDDAVVRAEWSPDGAALAYQKVGEIRVFDVAKGNSRSLIKGTLQAWSPNGKWIVFRSADRRAALVTPEGVPVDWPMSRYHIESSLSWSPDGRFVNFDALYEIPLLMAYHRPVVCRVSDGACSSIAEAPVGLRWIVNYRSVLKSPPVSKPSIEKM